MAMLTPASPPEGRAISLRRFVPLIVLLVVLGTAAVALVLVGGGITPLDRFRTFLRDPDTTMRLTLSGEVRSGTVQVTRVVGTGAADGADEEWHVVLSTGATVTAIDIVLVGDMTYTRMNAGVWTPTEMPGARDRILAYSELLATSLVDTGEVQRNGRALHGLTLPAGLAIDPAEYGISLFGTAVSSFRVTVFVDGNGVPIEEVEEYRATGFEAEITTLITEFGKPVTIVAPIEVSAQRSEAPVAGSQRETPLPEATTGPTIPPALVDGVSDEAGVLSDEDESNIWAAVQQTYEETGLFVFVKYVRTTGDQRITDWASSFAEANKLPPNVAVFVVAVDDRTDAIWVADGVSDDAELERILAQHAEPWLRDGNYVTSAIAVVQSLHCEVRREAWCD